MNPRDNIILELRRGYLGEVPNEVAKLCALCENFALFAVKEITS